MRKSKSPLDPAVEAKLARAIRNRDAAEVKRLIDTGIDVNVPLKSERNQTPLSLATQFGTNDVAVMLFKAGADWREGGLNLVWSVYFRDEWLTRQLIEAGADVNFKGNIMGRPLALATSYNLPNLMRLLIDAGADVNADSPLTNAVSANHTEAALMLLKARAIVPKDQQLLPWAAQRGNREILHALIQSGANLDEKATLSEFDSKRSKHVTYCNHATALIIAAANGAEQLVQDLIEAGADLYAKDATGATALDRAREQEHAEVLGRLEAAMARKPRQADPSADLIFAAEKGDTALVKGLLRAGADPNVRDNRPKSRGFTPLMLAARFGHREAAAALLDAGADLALKDDDNDPGNDMGFNFIFNEGGIEHVLEAGFSMSRTALHWAAEKGHTDVARLLIEHSTDVNGVDRAKLTPLHIAAEAGASMIVCDLLKAGADPDTRAKGKETPLHHACRSGNVEIVRALLQAGAKAELKNDNGNTPLIIAAGRAHPAVVTALLEAGANVHTANRTLETALGKACGPQLYEHKYSGKQVVVRFLRPESEILETIRLLVAAGADPTIKDKHDFNALDWANRGLKDSKFYVEVIELLKQAQPPIPSSPAPLKKPGPATEAKASAKPTKPKNPAGEAPAPRPDFSAAAAQKKFQAALKELEKLCGTKPQPMDQVKGGFTVHISSGNTIDLEKVQDEYLKRGCYVFSPDSTFDQRIGVLPTTDKYQVLLAMQTNGQNYDLMPQDVVAWLRALEKDQTFVLTSAGFDFLGGRFTTKIAKPAALAKRMYEFCPDVVDQGSSDTKALAAELGKSRTFFFWWD